MANYSRYSHHARRAISHAGALAVQYRHPRIDTGHLLVGVLLTEGSIGCTVLHDLGLKSDTAAPYLQRLTLSLETAPLALVNDAALDVALELAADESIWLGHHYIGTEHLILGMTRTNVGNAGDLLRQLQVSPDLVRRRVRSALNDGLTEMTREQARLSARLSELARRVISAAEQFADAFDHHTIGLGHLLIALLQERRGVVPELMRGTSLNALQLQHDLNMGDALLLTRLDGALDQASELAEDYSSHYVGTEHLVLAMLLDPASQALLERYGVNTIKLKAAIEQQLRAL